MFILSNQSVQKKFMKLKKKAESKFTFKVKQEYWKITG